MITLSVRIENLDQLRSNFRRAPALALKYLAQATQAAIFEVEKQAVDKNFRFKWPRSMRTGYLALSFGYGRVIAAGGLRAAIGPTAHYAPYVYHGTSRGLRPNRYMDRIAAAAEAQVGRHFEKAIDKLTSDIAKV
jgi:hypothetical protein